MHIRYLFLWNESTKKSMVQRHCIHPLTSDLDYGTLETQSTVARYTTVGCWIPNNNEIRLTVKAGFEKTDVSRLGPSCRHRYRPEDTPHAGLFRDTVSIHCYNLIEIVGAVFEKISISCFGTHLKLHPPSSSSLKLKCSDSPDNNLTWINSWIRIKIKSVQPIRH
jgi:hypothetical protein